MCIRDIDAAIARKGEQDFYSRVSIAQYVGALRTFFRYAEQRRWCSRGLAAAIMCPRVFAVGGGATSACPDGRRSSQKYPRSCHYHALCGLRLASR
jgi:hypothetical protein